MTYSFKTLAGRETRLIAREAIADRTRVEKRKAPSKTEPTAPALLPALLLCVLCVLCGCSSTPPPAPQTLASRAGYTAEHLAGGAYRIITAPIQDARVCIVSPSGITLLEIDNRAPFTSGTFNLFGAPK